MVSWVRAILHETWLAGFTFLSALSTVATFFLPKLAGQPRFISMFCIVLGFAVANWRVYEKQSKRISELESALKESSREPIRKSDLRIHPYEHSCFTLVTNFQDRSQLRGMHVNLDMALENRGNRGTTIHRYDLYVHETDKTYQDIRPNLGFIEIQGRYCVRSIRDEPKITTDGLVRVQPETTTSRGFLPFFPLEAPVQITGPVHCRLTVTDMDGNSTSQEFELREV
jgi:hypothetical protein